MRSMNSKKMNVHFLLDPLESLHGPLMPAYLIAKELREKFDFVFVSQTINGDVAEQLSSCGFRTYDLHKHFLFSGSLLTLEAWLRRTRFEPSNAESSFVVNFSQCFLADAHVYYAQGPMIKALDDMRPEMNRTYSLAYGLARWAFIKHDKAFVKKIKERSKLIVANSGFCARMYEDLGFKVDAIIYPPSDCELFKPATVSPSGAYALAYAGKETKYSMLKKIAEVGVKVKAFGSKVPFPDALLRQPNLEFVGKVTDKELVDLYSNALFTLSVFTHEPFGYIPVESMACGTPVLTYNRQGPSESVINGKTGWFVENDQQLVNVALKLWKKGYPSSFRQDCRQRALDFDVKKISNEWLKLIKGFSEI